MSLAADCWQPSFGPLAFPNTPFVTPNDSRWGEVFIVVFDTTRVSLGSTLFLKRSVCSLQFNLYCPKDKGTKENTEAADAIETFFEGRQVLLADGDDITFETPNSFDVTGVDERREGTNSNWHRSVVDCRFVRNATVSK